MGSLKEIAVACNVSVATVSKALNDHNDISEETKELVRKTAREMNYLPNAHARALKTNRTKNIGVLFEDEAKNGLTHDFFAGVLDSFKRTVEKRGYDITFVNNNKEGRNGLSITEHCKYRGFDGVMIACIDFEDEEVLELISSGLPIVIVDRVFRGHTSIISDNIKGMRELLDYIYDMGHRKIAFIHGDSSSPTNDRLYSFYSRVEELGLKIPDEYIKNGAYRSISASTKATAELLDLDDPPTCIIYPDDYAAFGGRNEINRRKMKIPNDISIAGYDGIRIGRHIEPQLTTIRQDTENIGRKAANNLLTLIERPDESTEERIVVSGTLIKGKTVKKIRTM
jgi:LacI family transcriptional regulator/LacI family purine nucleotide synthesis repressor